MAAQGPTFAPSYVAPGVYVQQQDVSTPNVPQGTRIPAVIGQGAKTALREETLTKGASNGTDGPLTNNIAISIVALIDSNNVTYVQGTDFLLTRPTADTAVVDWSPKASLTGSVDLLTLTYPTDLDGKTLRLVVNGGTGNPADQAVVFTLPADANAVVSQINAWHASLVGVASLDVNNQLVLTANSIDIEEGDANSFLGFVTGDFASVQEPATGVTYRVQYTSDKTTAEYEPRLYSNMNDVITAYGALQQPTTLYTATASGAATKTLSVAGTPWTVNQFAGNYVKITSGPGKGQVRVIISNTTAVLTLSQDWTQFNVPTGASQFVITDVNENSISLGGQTAFDAGATFLIASQYADDLFDAANIKLAIDNLEESVQGFNPECLVLMRGIGLSELSIVTYLKNHVVTMSNTVNNKFRVAIIGLASGTDDFTDIISVATGTAERRITLMNISSVNKDFGTGQGLVTLDGSYVAAGYTGIYCAAVDAGEPIIRKSLGAVFDVDSFSDPFLVVEKNQMAANGVTVIERQGLDIRIRHDLTTDPSTSFTWGAKYTRIADFISNITRQTLNDTVVGRRFTVSSSGTNDIASLSKANLTFVYNSLTNSQRQMITKPVENLSVTQNATQKSQLDVNAKFTLVGDVVWVYSLLNFQT